MTLRGRAVRRLARVCVALVLLLVVALPGCSRDKAESKPSQKEPARRPGTVPVAVAVVEKKDVPLELQAIGAVEAYMTVTVRALIGGELQKIHFSEGQDVKAGDLLFTIDPRPYEAALAQTQANLAKDRVQVQQARATLERDRARVAQSRANLLRDQAQAKNAETQEQRYSELMKRDLIAREQYDQIKTNNDVAAAALRADEADIKSAEETVAADQAAVASAQETVRADEAAVENAKILLGYTTIRSPLDGRTGSLQLHEGNVVRANDSALLVINKIQPVYVSFTVPQQQLPQIKKYMADAKLIVSALPSGDPRPARGVVSFIDNAVDPATGTIRLKATFTNDDRRLWPGQFVNVALTLTTDANVLVVPAAAVQTGQQGRQYVFVVKEDLTADTRPVSVLRTQGSESIIGQGLRAGEKVVTDGHQRLVAGTKVEIRVPGGPARASGPGGGAPGGAPAAGGPAGPGDGGAAPGGPGGRGKAPGGGAERRP